MTSFLIDQQLPQALATYLTERGYDSRHIKDYPDGATMPDPDVAQLADSESRFIVTKDDDFRIAHLLRRAPRQLLHLTCGNISTRDLLALFDELWPPFEAAVSTYSYLEINRSGVVIHDPLE